MTEDTEFNDALRRHGILPQREPPPRTPSPPPSPTLHEALADLTADELRELEEDATDDDLRRIVDASHRQRLAEEQKATQRARFGRVYPIGREDYTREVTEASKEDDQDERGTGVICFLYKDGIPRSDRTFSHVRDLAVKYPRTKFVSIVGDKCIADLPDSRIPMLIIYRKGEIRHQLVAWGADRERRLEELEAILILCGAVDPSEHPTRAGPKAQDRSDDSSEEDDDPSSRMRSATTRTNARAPKNVRGPPKDDSDSEFEFDM